MAKSRVEGASALMRTIRLLPETAREELGDALFLIGQRLLGRAKAGTPVKTGRLRNALSSKVARKSLNLRLGLVTKSAQRKFFYGYILDSGRRARTAKVTRRTAGGVSSYAMRVRGISRARYDIVFDRRRDLQTNEIPELRNVLDRVLGRAARGE